MNPEEIDREVMDRIERLRASRRRYSESVHELQETARKLTILVSLLADSPTDIWNSSDRESVQFIDNEGGDELYISRSELDALPDKIGRTLLSSREIAQAERSLIDAGCGDLISP